MIFGLSYYEICSDFLIYSFLGWVLEVVYNAVKSGKIVNRGFLNGPLCPIYGVGMVCLMMFLNSIDPFTAAEDTNVFVLFGAGFLFGSAVELIGGWILDKLFHMRWWDYSKQPFNIKGYVCLGFSLLWGIGCIVVVGMIYPLIAEASGAVMEYQAVWIIMLILYAGITADLTVTICTIAGLNKKLKEIDTLSRQMRTVSDAMTEHIGSAACKTADKIEEKQVQASLAKDTIMDKASAAKDEAAAQYEKMGDRMFNAAVSVQMQKTEYQNKLASLTDDLMKQAVRKSSGLHRMLTAFPNMQSHISFDTINSLKKSLLQKNRKNEKESDS